MSKLEFTGERLVPGIEGKIAAEHLHRYAMALELSIGKSVLDIASGEGYGSNLLADYAAKVVGIDISGEAILHSKTSYPRENLTFKQGDVRAIPCEDGSFDLIVSFETIEHISDHSQMFSELKRVLKSDGVLIISTPEKSIYSDQVNYSNPFHEKELYEKEFIGLISKEFDFHHMFYQKYRSGSFLLSGQNRSERLKFYSGNFNGLDLNQSVGNEYLIAICSNMEVRAPTSNSFFDSFELEKDFIEEIVSYKIKKWKSGFRYRMIDMLFKPWDIIKRYLK